MIEVIVNAAKRVIFGSTSVRLEIASFGKKECPRMFSHVLFFRLLAACNVKSEDRAKYIQIFKKKSKSEEKIFLLLNRIFKCIKGITFSMNFARYCRTLSLLLFFINVAYIAVPIKCTFCVNSIIAGIHRS